MKPFGTLVDRIDERSHGLELPLMSVSQIHGVVRRSFLTEDPHRAENLDVYKVCRRGDIVFNKMSVRSGAMGVAAENGLITYHYEVMRPRPTVDPRFVVYQMKSDYFTSQLVMHERGIGAGGAAGVRTTEVPFSKLRTIKVYAPPLENQKLIADFLDRETAQIDAMTDAQQRLVEFLKERRTAAILDTVMGRPDVAWRGHLGRVLTRLSRPVENGSEVVTAYRDGVVVRRSERRDDGYTFSDLEQGYQGVMPGDLVFHGLDGFAGAVGVSRSAGKCSPVYHVCSATSAADSRYVAFLLRALGQTGFLEAYAWSVRQRSVDYRNWHQLAELPVELPTPDSQREAVNRLEGELAEIDRMTVKVEQAVSYLRERRAAVITAAVTGRLDPRTGVEQVEEIMEGAVL